MNVVALKNGRSRPDALLRTEFRLSENCRVLEITAVNSAGNIAILEYVLASTSPADFDLDLWRQHYDHRLRGRGEDDE